IYVAYTGYGASVRNLPDDTDVFMLASSDDGRTWLPSPTTGLLPGQLDDDTPLDNFSEGNRPQFGPELAVDQNTGTLVATYYDGRYDPSRTRLVTSLAASSDGGATFTPAVYLNTPSAATDAITGQSVSTEPIPSNETVAGTAGFGDEQ